MAVWPFGRKAKAKNGSARDVSPATEKLPLARSTHPDTAAAAAGTDTAKRPGRKLTRSESNRQRRRSTRSNRSSKRTQQAQAREKGAHDPMPTHAKSTAEHMRTTNNTNTTTTTITTAAAAAAANNGAALPADAKGKTNLPPAADESPAEMPSFYLKNAPSHTTISSDQRSSWQRPPTLRAKRSANDPPLLRRKSSKKRKSDHVREEEIRSMSSPIPIPRRPVTHGGGPIEPETKKAAAARQGRRPDRPTSDLSLPIPESLHSSYSSSSDLRGFKVRSLDVLSPRPTIRYSQPGRYPFSPPIQAPSRSSSKREKRATIPEETLKESKTIDDLANDLDAGGLRELMERDARRREKKHKSDEDRMQRRLKRKAEKQKEIENGDHGDVDIPPNMDRGAMGREAAAMGIGQPATAPATRQTGITSDLADADKADQSPVSWLQDPSRENIGREDPFADRAGGDSKPQTEEPTPADEQEEPILGTAQAVRVSQGTMSPPRSPKYNIFAPPNVPPTADLTSHSVTDVSEVVDVEPAASASGSDQQPYTGTWTDFFRRSLTRGKRSSAERGRATASPFSNTSRDSLQRQPPPRPPVYQNAARRKSGTPIRTTSKFKEDLPELPLSPPDSRVQSPEAPLYESVHENLSPERAESSLAEKISSAVSSADAKDPFGDPTSRVKGDSSARGSRSIEAPSPDDGAPSTALSQSLASIDSEGSWLSGRPAKRNSQPLAQPPPRGSASSLPKRYPEFSDSTEELGVAEDEYFSRLTPGLEPSYGGTLGAEAGGKPGSTAIASDGGEETEQGTLHGAVARQPTIVHHGSRAKSSEGLLNQFQEGEDGGLVESPISPESAKSDKKSFDDYSEEEMSRVQRARSVDMGMKHVRHISAGSAKLLDIQHRPLSGEQKRISSGSQSRQ
ncbi:MAG: hypothetical protein M1837_003091 [Sclerophora amabilis]|nr:MAG: hypothetical protein M1837_003091 [Sclerophora amabilis]